MKISATDPEHSDRLGGSTEVIAESAAARALARVNTGADLPQGIPGEGEPPSSWLVGAQVVSLTVDYLYLVQIAQ
ncbi:MAG: hypothetical protein V4515_12340 [Chloroflexota bacterium]